MSFIERLKEQSIMESEAITTRNKAMWIEVSTQLRATSYYHLADVVSKF